jgi:flagellar basal-body rod modification protein FlgD
MRVAAVAAQGTTPAPRAAGGPDLDKSTFLQLLVAQLKNQDPLNPMDNQQFVAQLAQLRTLEQIETLNTSSQLALEMEAVNQSMALVGRQVDYRSEEDSTTKSGVVQRVQITGGMPTLIVDGHEVAPGDVTAVGPA